MIKQYCIYIKSEPNKVFEVIPSGVTVQEDCPFFYSMGNPFECDIFGVREMTEREIKELVIPKTSETNRIRRQNEYNQWVTENDKNESEGNKSFFIDGVKYYTINRTEFRVLKDDAISLGKRTLEYRGRTFSVFHFC